MANTLIDPDCFFMITSEMFFVKIVDFLILFCRDGEFMEAGVDFAFRVSNSDLSFSSHFNALSKFNYASKSKESFSVYISLSFRYPSTIF